MLVMIIDHSRDRNVDGLALSPTTIENCPVFLLLGRSRILEPLLEHRTQLIGRNREKPGFDGFLVSAEQAACFPIQPGKLRRGFGWMDGWSEEGRRSASVFSPQADSRWFISFPASWWDSRATA
jgi:hypothetical protein